MKTSEKVTPIILFSPSNYNGVKIEEVSHVFFNFKKIFFLVLLFFIPWVCQRSFQLLVLSLLAWINLTTLKAKVSIYSIENLKSFSGHFLNFLIIGNFFHFYCFAVILSGFRLVSNTLSEFWVLWLPSFRLIWIKYGNMKTFFSFSIS